MMHGSRDGAGYPHSPIYKIGAIIRHSGIVQEMVRESGIEPESPGSQPGALTN